MVNRSLSRVRLDCIEQRALLSRMLIMAGVRKAGERRTHSVDFGQLAIQPSDRSAGFGLH
jgi:hypothetical protein